MAKELKFKDDNDIGFDSDLKIPSFSMREGKVGKDRNPVLKGIKDAGEGVVTGIWDAATSESFIKKVLKQALPDGYGAAIDTFDLAGQNLKKLYDSSEKQFKPLTNDIKRTVARLLPQQNKVMPKSLYDGLKRWSDSAEGSSTGMSQSQMRENNLTGTLGEVFKYQIETDAKNRAEDQARANIKEQIDTNRASFNMEALNSIKFSLQRLVDYQDKVTINYQRRSLELQYRQYFVQLDAFQHQRETSMQTRQLLEGIQKNTGLPDIRKIQGLGDYKDLIRNKFFNNIGGMMFGERSMFMQRIVENIQKALAENVTGFINTARTSIAGANEMAEFAKSSGDMGGPSGANLAGNMAGDLVFSNLGEKLGYKAYQHIQKMPQAKHINKLGKWLDYHFGNGPQHLTELAHSKKGDDLPMGLGWMVQFAKQMVHQSNVVDTGLRQDDIRNLQEPAVFNGMARKSLTEIIPGYLARIYQELQIIRTGDAKTDLMLFDPTSNRFKSAKETSLGIHKLLFKKEEMAANKKNQDDLITELQKKSGIEITPEMRKDVIGHLMNLNFQNRLGTPKNLADRYAYMGVKGVSNPGAMADMFAKYFGSKPTQDQLAKFQRMMNGLSYGMTDNRGTVQGLLNMGYGSNLEAMGMLTPKGNFNLDQFGKYYQGTTFDPQGMYAQGALNTHLGRGKTKVTINRNNSTTHNTSNTTNNSTVNNNIENVVHNIATEIAARLHQEFTVQPPSAPSSIPPVAAAVHAIRRKKFQTSALARQPKASEHITTLTGRQIHKDHNDAYVAAQARVHRLANSGFGRAALKKRYPDWMPGLEQFPHAAVDDEFHKATGLDHQSAMHPKGFVASAFGAGAVPRGDTIGMSRLEQAIKAASSKSVAEQILEELKKLSSGIKSGKGVQVFQINGEDVGDLLQRSARRGTNFMDQSLRNFGTDMVNNTVNVGKWILGRPAAMGRMAMGAWKGTKGLRDNIKLFGKKTGEAALKVASRWDDVYLPGVDEPVLEAWKLRAGYYINEKGDAIRSWKDINGTIRDTSENSEVRLSGSQIDRAYIRSQVGPKMLKALGSVWSFGWKNLMRMKRGIFSVVPMAVTMAKKGWNLTKNLLDQPQDIYVKGKSDPVMNARTMRAGLYRSARDLNKVIHRPGDIDGPVIDTSVNPPVIALTREDLQNGIYDAMGKPIKTPMQKILGAAMAPLRWLKNTTKFGFEFAMGLLKKPFQYIGQFFTNWFGPDGLVIAGSKTIITRLTEIRDVLKDRLPNPKKIRRGSWEDLESKAKKTVGAGSKASGPNVDKGFLGKAEGVAGNMATGLLEKLGLIKKQKKPGEKSWWDKTVDWGKDKVEEGVKGWAWEKGAEKAKDVGGRVKDSVWNRIKNRGKAAAGDVVEGVEHGGKKGFFRGALHGAKDLVFGPSGASGIAGKVGDTSSSIYKAVREGVADGMQDANGGGIGDAIKNKLEDKMLDKFGKFRKAGKLARQARTAGKVVRTARAVGTAAEVAEAGLGAAEVAGGVAGGAGLATGAGGLLAEMGLTAAAAGAGIGGTLLTGVTLAAGVAASLGTAALGILASPVVITAGLIAGGMYLANKAHNGLKSFMLHRKLGKLGFMRMAQYGFTEDDTDHIRTILEFEQTLMEHVTYDAGGRAQLDHKKLNFKEALEPFGIDAKNQDDLKSWLVWFAQRFRPVFLNSLNALRQVDKKKKLIDVDDLKKEDKAEYFKTASFAGGPYRINLSPFHRSKFLFIHFGSDKLQAGPKEVAAAVAAAHKEVGDPDPKKLAEKQKKLAAAGVTATASAINKKDGKKEEPHSFLGKIGAKVGSGLAMIGGAMLGGGLAAMAGKWLKNEWGKISNNADTKGMSFGDKLAVFLSPSLHHLMTGTKLHPFQALRYQAYGLHDYDQDKVAALAALEGHLGTRLKFSGEGDKSKVEFVGDPMDVLMHFGASFDPSNVSEKGNSNAHEWLEWFIRRFLPVYLTYRGSFMKIAGFVNSVGGEPNDAQAAQLAPLVNAAKGQDGVSAWKIKSSPWPKYHLNTDPDSVSAILAFIKEKAKTKKLSDGVTKKKEGDGGKGWTDIFSGKSLKEKVDQIKDWGKKTWDKVESGVSHAWSATKDAAGKAWTAAKNTKVGKAITGVADRVGDSMKGFGASLGKGYKAVVGDAKKVKDAALAALKGAGITNPTEVAMFMAQMDTESGGFKSLSENLKYSAATLMKLFGKKLSGGMQQAQQIASQGAEAVANFIYGNRMGNSAPDDGFKYRGRGIIQLTGKDNYTKYGKMLGLDLVNNPDLAADPKVAAQIAVAYWKTRVSSSAAQAGNVQQVTQEINGGQNGLASRQQNFQKYMQEAKSGQLQPSDASPDDKKAQQTAASGAGGSGVGAATPSKATAGALPTGGANSVVAGATAPASGKDSSAPTVASMGSAQPTPSVTSTASSINKVSTSDVAAAASQPSGGGASPFGFNMASAKSTTPPAKNILAVQQAQHEEKMNAMGNHSDLMQQSLDVQTDARDILKTILSTVQELQKKGGDGSDGSTPSSNGAGGNQVSAGAPKSSLRGQRQPMPTPPVSMLNEV
jgi:predicted chitinase